MSENQTETLFDLPAPRKVDVVLGQSDKDFQRTFAKPLAHRDDPLSSYQAGEKILKSGKLRGQMRAVYFALKQYPNTTSAELSRYASLDRYNIARRLSVLANRDLIERGPERMCRVCHSPCVTWRAK